MRGKKAKLLRKGQPQKEPLLHMSFGPNRQAKRQLLKNVSRYFKKDRVVTVGTKRGQPVKVTVEDTGGKKYTQSMHAHVVNDYRYQRPFIFGTNKERMTGRKLIREARANG